MGLDHGTMERNHRDASRMGSIAMLAGHVRGSLEPDSRTATARGHPVFEALQSGDYKRTNPFVQQKFRHVFQRHLHPRDLYSLYPSEALALFAGVPSPFTECSLSIMHAKSIVATAYY